MILEHATDHVPAAEERVHRLEQFAASVEDTHARRTEDLVARERVEIAA